MRRKASLVAVLLGAAGALLACDRAECGAGDVCPPPIIGTGELRGQLVDPNGAPLRNERVYSVCYGVGVSDRRTNDQGRFVSRFHYMAAEPPADAATGETFVRYCRVNLEERVLRDSIPVTFYAEQSEVVPTEVQIIVHE